MKSHVTNTFRLRLHSISKIQVFIIFLLLPLPVMAQEALPEIRPLVIVERAERKVSADEEDHIYGIEIKRGQVLRVNFQEKGADVSAVVIRASGQQLLVEPKAWSRNVGFGTSLAYGDLSPLPYVPNEISKIFGNRATKQASSVKFVVRKKH